MPNILTLAIEPLSKTQYPARPGGGKVMGGVFAFDDVWPDLLENRARPVTKKCSQVSLVGLAVAVNTMKLQTFLQQEGALCCANPECKMRPQFVVIERHSNAGAAGTKKGGMYAWHMSLYGINEFGHWIEFTHDHIIARGLGGVDQTVNTVPMCSTCNSKKSQLEALLCQSNTTQARAAIVASALQTHIERITGQPCDPKVLLSRHHPDFVETEHASQPVRRPKAQKTSAVALPMELLAHTEEKDLADVLNSISLRRQEKREQMLANMAARRNLSVDGYRALCEVEGALEAQRRGPAVGTASTKRQSQMLGLTLNAFRHFRHDHNMVEITERLANGSMKAPPKHMPKLHEADGLDAKAAGAARAAPKVRAAVSKEPSAPTPSQLTISASRRGMSNDGYRTLCEDEARGRLAGQDEPTYSWGVLRKARRFKMSPGAFMVMREHLAQPMAVKSEAVMSSQTDNEPLTAGVVETVGKHTQRRMKRMTGTAARLGLTLHDHLRLCHEQALTWQEQYGPIPVSTMMRAKAKNVGMTAQAYWIARQHDQGIDPMVVVRTKMKM